MLRQYRSDWQVRCWLTCEWLWVETSPKWHRASGKWASQNIVTSSVMRMPAMHDVGSDAGPDLSI